MGEFLLNVVWFLIDESADVLAIILGFDPENLREREQQAVAGAATALIPFSLYQLLVRVRIFRLIWSKETRSEGAWIEKIRMGTKTYVTIVTIGRRLFSNRYYASGETFDFEGCDFRDPKLYAEFNSDSLHFASNHQLIVTFNYSSSIVGGETNRIGLATYKYPNRSPGFAHGWFVGVLNGLGEVRPQPVLTRIDLERLTLSKWFKAAHREKELLSSFFKWETYLSWRAFIELKAQPSDVSGDISA